jgi:dihydroorotate dehydrogenase electron transfer subunit
MLAEEQVVRHEDLGDPDLRLRRLVLHGPIARTAKAGQFVAIQVQDQARLSMDPLLRRPISIAEISPEREEITLLYRVKGRGTEILAQAKCGELLSVIGPLGNGFSLSQEGELWLAAGGIGIFPLYALAQSALNRGLGVRLFWGGETKLFLESAGLSQWRALGIPLHLSTMDGSLGHHGLVTELMEIELLRVYGLAKQEYARNDRENGGEVRVAVCGPKKMMESCTELALRFNVPVEVSLEERMGCAVGACLGCVCALRNETKEIIHKKVCTDGPVFRGEEVVWDESC